MSGQDANNKYRCTSKIQFDQPTLGDRCDRDKQQEQTWTGNGTSCAEG